MIKKFNKISKDKTILSKLQTQYNKNTELSKIICNILPDEFSLYISQCFFNQNTLTIITTNQLIASKLRYSLPQIKKQLIVIPAFKTLKKIRLQISTPTPSPKQDKNKNISKPVYSDKSAELVLSLADCINNDELQQSLKKLSQHIKPK